MTVRREEGTGSRSRQRKVRKVVRATRKLFSKTLNPALQHSAIGVSNAAQREKTLASAPSTTARAAHTAALPSLPAALSRPPEVAVAAEGQGHRASGPPAHARTRECRPVGSGGQKRAPASATCAGRSGRGTARRSCPAAPPGPAGEPPARPAECAARLPAFAPDLDLRHQRRHEENRLLVGKGATVGGSVGSIPS